MAEIDLSKLAQFHGSEKLHRHWLGRFVYTEGVAYLYTNGAAWLVDAIASYQGRGKLADVDFQEWMLIVADERALLRCSDGSRKLVSQKVATKIIHIEYTDFPTGEVLLYVENGVLMLASER